ncbi:hypothetical protein C8245_12485 [Paracidovorax avenae]|uniref:hypothetical protein n=1 Tax=Paracidovorax avenae TaxID=80867 RepID=UPI000D220CDC|nr:hypothetical protein [Paracidovorax avenae]AVS66381.1 hypothetical protein C8245_12485 [Paracidovorax avenae]
MGNDITTLRPVPRTLGHRARALGHRALAVASVTLLTAVPALAADATTPEQSIADAVAKLLLIIAAGGAAYVTLSLAGVGWKVGAKWIKGLRGAA